MSWDVVGLSEGNLDGETVKYSSHPCWLLWNEKLPLGPLGKTATGSLGAGDM